MGKVSAERREEVRGRLLDLLPPGTTVYTVLRHVSKSGMTRDIDLYVMKGDEPRWISGWVADLLGMPRGRGYHTDTVRIQGAGMDMGFALVYDLSRALYPDGFDCVEVCEVCGERKNQSDNHGTAWSTDGKYLDAHEKRAHRFTTREGVRCGGNSHSNSPREDVARHADGGYALTHRWL